MKLKVYQQGGGLIYTPFIPARTESTITGESKDTNGDDSKIDPLDKEILALMKDKDLLPSDIEAISSALIGFQRRTQHLGNPALGGSSDYRSVMPGMLQIMQMVSTARFNRKQWDNSVAEMQKHDAGSEVAMDSYGKMFVIGEDGKLSKISPNEYDRTKHHAISNSELLQYRERVAGMDGQLLNAMDDLVGKQDVYKAINEIIKAYGTQDKVAFLTKDKNIQDVFIDLNAPEGIYNVKKTHTAADLQKAFKILYDELPTNMQHLLKANAALAGEENPELGAYKFINSIINNNIDRKVTASFDASATKEAGMGHTARQEQLTQNNYLIQVGNLQGTPTRVDIYPRAAKINERGALNAQAYTFGQVIDRNEKPIDKMSVANMLKDGWAFAAGVPGSITFGNKLMKDYELEALLFDDQSNLTAVMLPYRHENGHIVPDFDVFDKFNKLQEIIDNNPGMSKMEISTQATNLGLNPNTYKIENGAIRILDTMAFLTVSAYAGDDTLDLDKDTKRYLEKVENRDGQHLKDVYNNMVMYGKLRPAKKGNVAIKGYSKSEKNDFWRGNVYMPIQNAYYSLLLSGIGEYVPKTDMTDYLERTIALDRYNQSVQQVQQNDPNYEQNKLIGQFRDE